MGFFDLANCSAVSLPTYEFNPNTKSIIMRKANPVNPILGFLVVADLVLYAIRSYLLSQLHERYGGLFGGFKIMLNYDQADALNRYAGFANFAFYLSINVTIGCIAWWCWWAMKKPKPGAQALSE